PTNYSLKSDHRTPVISGEDHEVVRKLMAVENAERSHMQRTDSIVGQVDYQALSTAEAEKQIAQIRDSMAIDLDQSVYNKFILSGRGVTYLYTLIKYSRNILYILTSATEMDSLVALLNHLDPEVRDLPSARELEKLFQHAWTLLPGNK